VRTHELVLARIERDLSAGRLAVGDRLPAERTLAAELGVSRASVREAIRVLEAMGIIRTNVGSGPDAGAVVIDNPAAGMTSGIRLHVASHHVPVGDVVQLRVMLETWSVARVADLVRTAGSEGVTPPDLVGASEVLGLMDESSVTIQDFHRLDAAFHGSLVALSGNVLVAAVMAGLRGAIHDYVLAGSLRLPDWPATAARLRAEHRGILAAVEGGAPDEAAERVRAHIEGFCREAELDGATSATATDGNRPAG
jgi:GntR family transcriptional repressor for pyruvate dehydrogenase complex